MEKEELINFILYIENEDKEKEQFLLGMNKEELELYIKSQGYLETEKPKILSLKQMGEFEDYLEDLENEKKTE